MTKEEARALLAHWSLDTSVLSSTTQINKHPSFQLLQKAEVSFLVELLREDTENTWHLTDVLSAITGERLVPEEHAGEVDYTRHVWLQWAQERGL